MNLYGLLLLKERLNFHPHTLGQKASLEEKKKKEMKSYSVNQVMDFKVECFAYAFKTIESI